MDFLALLNPLLCNEGKNKRRSWKSWSGHLDKRSILKKKNFFSLTLERRHFRIKFSEMGRHTSSPPPPPSRLDTSLFCFSFRLLFSPLQRSETFCLLVSLFSSGAFTGGYRDCGRQGEETYLNIFLKKFFWNRSGRFIPF